MVHNPKVAKFDGGVPLPENIVFEVLVRVPAKNLCRFQCVCNGWCALISDPAFIAAQTCYAGSHLVGVFSGADGRPPEVRVMDMEGDVIRVFVAQVLSKGGRTNLLGVLQQATTGLKLICANNNTFIDPAAGRAWTMGTNTRFTFGRTALSGTLKVTCFEEGFLAPQPQICKVATIMEGGTEPVMWRETSGPPFRINTWHSRKRATVNGIIYFMPRLHLNERYSALNPDSNRIAAFDLESEEWKTINGPTFGVRAQHRRVTLTELNGTLGMIHCLCNGDQNYANIWLLTDLNKSVWVKEYNINMPKTWHLAKQLGALDDGRILLLVRNIDNVRTTTENKNGYNGRVFLLFYSPRTNEFTKFTGAASDTLILYTGSLLS